MYNKHNSKGLLKLKDLCRIIPYSESWIRSKIKQNLIPYYKVGRNFLFDPDEIMDVLRSNRFSNTSEITSKIQTKRRLNAKK